MPFMYLIILIATIKDKHLPKPTLLSAKMEGYKYTDISIFKYMYLSCGCRDLTLGRFHNHDLLRGIPTQISNVDKR